MNEEIREVRNNFLEAQRRHFTKQTRESWYAMTESQGDYALTAIGFLLDGQAVYAQDLKEIWATLRDLSVVLGSLQDRIHKLEGGQ